MRLNWQIIFALSPFFLGSFQLKRLFTLHVVQRLLFFLIWQTLNNEAHYMILSMNFLMNFCSFDNEAPNICWGGIMNLIFRTQVCICWGWGKLWEMIMTKDATVVGRRHRNSNFQRRDGPDIRPTDVQPWGLGQMPDIPQKPGIDTEYQANYPAGYPANGFSALGLGRMPDIPQKPGIDTEYQAIIWPDIQPWW